MWARLPRLVILPPCCGVRRDHRLDLTRQPQKQRLQAKLRTDKIHKQHFRFEACAARFKNKPEQNASRNKSYASESEDAII